MMKYPCHRRHVSSLIGRPGRRALVAATASAPGSVTWKVVPLHSYLDYQCCPSWKKGIRQLPNLIFLMSENYRKRFFFLPAFFQMQNLNLKTPILGIFRRRGRGKLKR